MNDQFWQNLSRPSPVRPGTRIRLTAMPNDPDPIKAGMTGTVLEGSNAAQIHVKWDDGRSLSLLPGVDHYSVIPQSDGSLKESN